MKYSIPLILAFALTGTATAQEGSGYRADFRGSGATKCREFIGYVKQDANTAVIIGWVYGFWTGINFSLGENSGEQRNLFIEGSSPDAIEARVLSYCYQNTDAMVFAAALEIFLNLPKVPQN